MYDRINIDEEKRQGFYKPAVSPVKKYWMKKLLEILKRRSEAMKNVSIILGFLVATSLTIHV